MPYHLAKVHKNLRSWLRDLMKHEGIVEPFFTSDGASVLKNKDRAKLDDELVSMNFKNHADENLKIFQSLFPSQPIWIMEYWAGWFDWWGEGRNLFDNQEFKENFDQLVDAGASINFYMFDGGTNFGFTNGGLYIARNYYTADVTSYDYDCPISETGNLTEKYFIIKNRIGCSILCAHNLCVRNDNPFSIHFQQTKPRS